MQPSMFNVRVPLADPGGAGDTFLLNTFTDAQLVVGPDVVSLLDRLDRGLPQTALSADERLALNTLAEHGFVVGDREAERARLETFFTEVRNDSEQLRVTVLTTLQCNFSCDYCIQGDHGDYNKTAARMTLDVAERVAQWTEARMDETGAASFVLTLFGGEPLLNLPVAYYLSERLWRASQARGIRMQISVITNGLLLTPEVVDRLLPFGLSGVKVTLDGDRDTHNRMRPLRGGQGTFDRIIDNIRQVAGMCRISIGGNFDEGSVDSYPALLDFLRVQEFGDKLVKVAFKPIIRETPPEKPKGFIPLTAIGSQGLNGSCMTSAGSGSSACDSCGVLDEKMSVLREETKKRGFATVDGVHMGPCEIHKRHAHTIGPDGSLYACPGFAGNATESTGHIDGRADGWRRAAASRFERIAAWKDCQDCPFIPVCAGGCSAAAYTELHDMNQPNCHRVSFEAGVVALARDAAQALPLEPAIAG
jgi:uncharacterized protein